MIEEEEEFEKNEVVEPTHPSLYPSSVYINYNNNNNNNNSINKHYNNNNNNENINNNVSDKWAVEEELSEGNNNHPPPDDIKYYTVDDAMEVFKKKRKWKCIIEHIRMEDADVELPVLSFILGHLHPNKYLKEMRTALLDHFPSGEYEFPDQFMEVIECSYDDLVEHFLQVDLFELTGCMGRLEKVGTSPPISLRTLASSSTKQKVKIFATEKTEKIRGNFNQKTQMIGYVKFRCRFEEICVFRLQFDDWSANLNAEFLKYNSELSLYPFRLLQFQLPSFFLPSSPPSPLLPSSHPLKPTWKRKVGEIEVKGSAVDLMNTMVEGCVYASDSSLPLLLLGTSSFPLLSLKHSSFFRSPLVMEVTEEWSEVGFKTTTLNKGSEQIHLQSVGSLEGQIQLTSFDYPLFLQSDLPRRLFPLHIYLRLHLKQITGLPSTLHHYFLITAEWNSLILSSPVLEKSESVLIGRSFYFPIHKCDVDFPLSLWHLSSLSVQVYDSEHENEYCKNYLGGCEIEMQRVINAPIDNMFDFQNTSRSYKDHLYLSFLGKPTPISLAFSASFQPSIPDRIRNEKIDDVTRSRENFTSYNTIYNNNKNKKNKNKNKNNKNKNEEDDVIKQKNTSKVLLEMEEEWIAKIPPRLRGREYTTQVEDENGKHRFLPTYLAKCAPPPSIRSANQIAAIISKMQWLDFHSLFPPSDLSSPFPPSSSSVLSMSLPISYSNASILGDIVDKKDFHFWTSPNTLLRSLIAPDPSHLLLHANLLMGIGKDVYVCIGRGFDDEEKIFLITREIDRSVTGWLSRDGLHLSLKERWKGRASTQSANQIATSPSTSSSTSPSTSSSTSSSPISDLTNALLHSDRSNPLRPSPLATSIPSAEKQPIKTNNIIINNIADINERMAAKRRVFHDGDAIISPSDDIFDQHLDQSTSMPMLIKKGIPKKEISQLRNFSNSSNGRLPFKELRIAFNRYNVWANLQLPDPNRLLFDFDDISQWLPFFPSPPPPSLPFYSPSSLSPPFPPSISSSLVLFLRLSIRDAIEKWRKERGMETGTLDEPAVTSLLTEGLLLHSSPLPSLADKMIEWEQRLEKNAPMGYQLQTNQFIHFQFCDPILVVNEIFSKYDLHCDPLPVRYAISCLLSSLPSNCCSLWICIAKFSKPLPLSSHSIN